MRNIATLVWALYSLTAISLGELAPRDCFVGGPPQCNNSITSDPTCRGLEVTTIDGWKRMDCDYALYNVPTPMRTTKKWLVVHAGGCDTYTEDLGDYFAVDMELNLFGLRPCGGFDDSLCANRHDYDSCAAFHTSWYLPALHPTAAPYGFGFNPPALVDIYHTPGTTMLFFHEYGSSNTSYNWYSADGCNASSKPIYMCVAGIDPEYANKFRAIKSVLETAFSNTPGFPCNLQVIDAVPYSQKSDPAVPCTGILREYNDPAVVGGDTSGAPNWAWEMPEFMTRAVQLATEVEPHGAIADAFRTAINIALCKQFNIPGRATCCDDEIEGLQF